MNPMAYLTQRRITPELMDDPQVDHNDLAVSLKFIRMVNRWLGGTAAALRQLQRWSRNWPKDRTITILDIGTGSADIPLAIATWARARGHRVKITAVDLHAATLQLARQYIGERSDIELVQHDALRLMDRFEPHQFDYAHAGMFLHHLQDIEVLTVLQIMNRLSAQGMIWNDLVRSRIAKLGVRLLTIGAPHIVQHDALVSVDGGFTRREALDLARRADLPHVTYRSHLLYRFTLVSQKQPSAGHRRNANALLTTY